MNIDGLGTLPMEQQRQILELIEELNEAKARESSHEDF